MAGSPKTSPETINCGHSHASAHETLHTTDLNKRNHAKVYLSTFFSLLLLFLLLLLLFSFFVSFFFSTGILSLNFIYHKGGVECGDCGPIQYWAIVDCSDLTPV